MPSDVVFFLKAMPTQAMRDLAWPADTKLVGLNPNKSGEPNSSDYSALAASLKGSDGRILPNLLDKYAKVDEVGRIAFLGFSAAHGFLDPYARNDEDRAATSAYMLMDATFDGFGAKQGKPGYVAFAEDAVDGDRLLWTATANSATWDAVNKKATHLTGTESWELVWNDVLEATGRSEREGALREPLPDPAGGVHQIGQTLFWYEYVNEDGSSQIAHTNMGKLIVPAFEAYLIPWWKGELGGSKALIIGAAIAGAAGAAWLAAKWLRRRRTA